MLATQDTLEPPEEEFNLPAITIDKLNKLCWQIHAVSGN
jgi:hypothetical protein